MDKRAEQARAELDAQLAAMCRGLVSGGGRVEPGRGRKGAKEEKTAADKKRSAADAQAKVVRRALGSKGKAISLYFTPRDGTA